MSDQAARSSRDIVAAELAVFALGARGLDEALFEICARVSATLSVDHCEVFEQRHATSALVFRVGVGWRHRTNPVTIGMEDDSEIARMMATGDVVAFGDLSGGPRVPMPALLAEHRITSWLCSVIRDRGKTYGALAVFSRTPRTFAALDAEFLHGVAAIIAAAIQRHEGERERIREVVEANREAGRRRDEFLATLVHEMRTPLSATMAALGVIRQMAGPEPDLQRAIRISERQTQHLRRLVDDVFDVSRLERGAMVLQTRPVNLKATVDEVLETTYARAVCSRALRAGSRNGPRVSSVFPRRFDAATGRTRSSATPRGVLSAVSLAPTPRFFKDSDGRVPITFEGDEDHSLGRGVRVHLGGTAWRVCRIDPKGRIRYQENVEPPKRETATYDSLVRACPGRACWRPGFAIATRRRRWRWRPRRWRRRATQPLSADPRHRSSTSACAVAFHRRERCCPVRSRGLTPASELSA